jgi:outer membrane protein OmpA-like peptidoglycan-associated protein
MGCCLSVCATVRTARAEERFFGTAELGVAFPLNDPYGDAYGIGAEGGIGVFRSLAPQLALGLRGSYGALTEEEEVGAGGYNFGTLTGVLRVRPLADPASDERSTGFWLEAAPGIGRVESETRFVFTPAVGYSWRVGPSLGIGPFARYLQVVEPDFDDARIGVIGVELTLERAARPAPAVADAPAKVSDRDGDAPTLQPARQRFIEGRYVVEERVFFEFDKAELRPEGQRELDEITSEYRRGADGSGLRIQGHADSRGSEPYNQELSRKRAQAVKNYLIGKGVPEAALDVEAYGEHRPAIPGADTEREHQQNRRVEFVIVPTK